jgi:hypothetical protein
MTSKAMMNAAEVPVASVAFNAKRSNQYPSDPFLRGMKNLLAELPLLIERYS